MGNSTNFYLKNGSAYWTMSPAGFYEDGRAHDWYVNSDGNANSDYVTSTKGVRPVLNLSANTLVSGSGTSSDPYIVK